MPPDYELDDEYINQLKQQNQREAEVLTNTSDFEEAKQKAAAEVVTYQEMQKKKKKELATINKWKAALKKNDMNRMNDEIGQAIGNLYNQAMNAFEDVNKNGVVVMKKTTDKNGTVTEEPIVNPALPIAQKILKDLDVTLGHFLLTPKSQKESPTVQVNIGISADEVQARFMKRYSKDLPGDEGE